MGNAKSIEQKAGLADDNLIVTNVSSGFRSERAAFTWSIENFDVVRQSKEQICSQKFEFLVGNGIGLPCKMACCLHVVDSQQYPDLENHPEDPETNWIGVYYNLVSAPETATHVNTQVELDIFNKSGEKYFSADGGVADLISKQGWGFPHVIPKNAPLADLPLIGGCLHVCLKFTLFAPNPTVTDSTCPLPLGRIDSIRVREMNRSKYNLLKDFQKLLNQDVTEDQSSPTFADVKILTKDEHVFRAHRAILSVRSSVFHAMFKNNMRESETGIIRIDDLSAATVSVLLEFIYTGTLPQNWYKPDVVVELTSAAAKYDLKDLLEFLDSRLGSICNEVTAGKLLLLASQLKLHQAEKQILEYIKRHGASKSKHFMSIVRNIAVNSVETN